MEGDARADVGFAAILPGMGLGLPMRFGDCSWLVPLFIKRDARRYG